ncbi:hypothetical protein COHA_008839 [Chlorella ohadii]|uniref:F-box domain-containing protein n=1 Tax=Chlorella ohadii TaxID=2649997 RepID=A0AAD5DJA2_9CHLO|nr:hypothetical protein COHA_008839 [Chlorella ohadii]
MPTSRASPFAQLPHDLLQRVAALLGDEDRTAMLDVCGSWAAAIEAAPALWPTAVLALAPSALNEFELRKDEYATRDRSLTICPAVDKVFDAIDSDHNAATSMVERAAALSPRCRRVRVQGDERVKRRLVRLALDYRLPPVWNGDSFEDAEVRSLESSLAADLSAATRLSSLELRITGAQHLLAVCNALPALRELKLDLYWCKTEHAQQAVDALRQLPQLAVSMGIQSYWGTEAAPSYLDTDGWELTDLPPLAGLPLTALRLLGNVSLPPDLLQLERLHSLELYCLFELTGWSDEPWSTLAQLSQLSIIETLMPDATKVAAAARLSEVHAPDAPSVERAAEFRSQLAALRPDVRITPETAS